MQKVEPMQTRSRPEVAAVIEEGELASRGDVASMLLNITHYAVEGQAIG
jgi:hypothetical protein